MENNAEIVVITDEVKERHFEDAMQILGGMSMIQEISSTIRGILTKM